MSRLLFLAIFLAILPAFLLSKQQPSSVRATPRQQGQPLSKFLTRGGEFHTPSGFSGSIDPTGWRMTYGSGGEPRFMPAAEASSSSLADTAWSNKFGFRGICGYVSALAVIGSDLYVAGNIVSAGNSGARNIARWNGHNWSSVGGGTDNAILALAVIGTDLYAGGVFAKEGNVAANLIARWDGSVWSPLGLGVTGDIVRALASSGTDLYVGGRFSSVGGIPASNIAKWNGSNWSVLGSGTNYEVQALTAIGTDLYAGGYFDTAGGVPVQKVAKWNGSNWSALGSGIPGVVYALASIGTDLYAGGEFGTAGGIPANNIAKWNGSSWSALGFGVTGDAFAEVYALAVNGSDLYVGGRFNKIGATTVYNVAKWNGSWLNLGSGIQGPVVALAASGSTVYAGGSFGTAGGGGASSIAVWNGAVWSGLHDASSGKGVNFEIYALAAIGTDLYAAGAFTIVGQTNMNYVAKWDGRNWSPLGSGANNSVYALTVIGTNLYAGGSFDSAGGARVNYIAMWDGSAWSALGAGMSDWVYALTTIGNKLYAGGFFYQAGGTTVYNIASWDGFAWSALGPGLDNLVNILTSSGTTLYAGGNFTHAGATVVNHIAKWDGSSWSALGTGVRGGWLPVVFALAAEGADLYAGGEFDTAGSVPAHDIAKWNGSSWSALGTGVVGADVTGLGVSGSDLYVTGSFTTAGGANVNNLARWDGSSWNAVGSGIDGLGYWIQPLGNDLYFGGYFGSAGGKPSACIASYRLGNSPIWSWVKEAGGNSDDGATGTAVDDSGNVYVTGTFLSTSMSFGATFLSSAGSTDIFVAKYTPQGNLVWAKSAGGAGDDYSTGIAVDRLGDVYISGHTQSATMMFDTVSFTKPGSSVDIFLAKYDRAGHALWVRGAGSAGGDFAYSVAADGSGNAFITGYFTSSSIQFGTTTALTLGGTAGFFEAKYSPLGVALWSRGASGGGGQYGLKVTADSAGNSYSTGSFNGTSITFGLNPALSQSGTENAFIVKYDTGGTALWSRSGNGGGSNGGSAIRPDRWGNVYLGGGFTSASINFGAVGLNRMTATGNLDVFLVKYSGGGNPIWATAAGGGSTDFSIGLDVDRSGNPYLTGWTQSRAFGIGKFSFPNGGSKNLYVAKYDSGGHLLWATAVGNTGQVSPSDIAVDQGGNSLIAGTYGTAGVEVFDPDTVSEYALSNDVFIGKLGANPVPQSLEQLVSLHSGWNLVSNPTVSSDDSVDHLFQGSSGIAIGYGAGGYQVTPTMPPGNGYWLKYPASTQVSISGSSFYLDSIAVIQGWNIIGSVSTSFSTAAITSVPPGMITSRFFGYNGSYYTTSTIDPGSGYWVKVAQSGKLVLSALGSAVPEANRIKIIANPEGPPPPPEEDSRTHPSVPGQFALYQNFPNPFNPVTVIRYELPVRSRVSLEIFNTLGQRVATLVDEVQDPGFRSAKWDGRNQSSGIYFYRIQTEKFTQTKKLVLVR